MDFLLTIGSMFTFWITNRNFVGFRLRLPSCSVNEMSLLLLIGIKANHILRRAREDGNRLCDFLVDLD